MTDEAVQLGRLYRTFDEHFGPGGGTRLIRAPGRVNLMGDHTDYNGLPVFPMALQRHTSILMRPRPDQVVRLINLDPRFPPRSFVLSSDIDPHPAGDWINYVKAAGQAIASDRPEPRGFDGVVAGNLPVAAGLSSSSSLVVASALGVVAANGFDYEPFDLMALLARGERYVGTVGGAMDQTISLAGIEGTALRIDFHPVRVHPVRVPAHWRFVVACSMVAAEKSGAAQAVYNRRVDECRRALDQVAAGMDRAHQAESYAELGARVPGDSLVMAAEALLDPLLLRRFRHVVGEGIRVEDAERAMGDNDMAAFGRLMLDSHRSLRDDFEVSCTELDELVDLAADAGAVGARMTGAGLGGCIVALCHEDRVEEVLDHLGRQYFRHRRLSGPIEDMLFVAQASAGARVLDA